MLQLNEANHGQEIEVSPGQELEICLVENPTTGFRWRLTQPGSPVCSLLNDAFEPGTNAMGQPGIHTWKIKVLAEGAATVELSYGRSWESDGAGARKFTVRLSCQK